VRAHRFSQRVTDANGVSRVFGESPTNHRCSEHPHRRGRPAVPFPPSAQRASKKDLRDPSTRNMRSGEIMRELQPVAGRYVRPVRPNPIAQGTSRMSLFYQSGNPLNRAKAQAAGGVGGTRELGLASELADSARDGGCPGGILVQALKRGYPRK